MATVEAHITKVEQDDSTGWYRIFTDDDTVKRLDTKIAEKAREAADLKKSGVLALIEFTEKQGNINPHTGGHYLNRYYEQAGSIDNGSSDGIDVVKSRGEDPERTWRICLQTGAKLAVAMAPLVEENQRTIEIQQRIAFTWARFFFFQRIPSPEELAFGGGSGFGTQYAPTGSASAGPYEQPPAPGDDDIPF